MSDSNQIDLKHLIEQHPEVLTDHTKLKAYILDLYPNCKRGMVNILVTIQQCGIVAEMQASKNPSALDMGRWKKCLEDDVGFTGALAETCLKMWCSAFRSDKTQERQSASPTVQFSEKEMKFAAASESEEDEDDGYAEGPTEEPDDEYYLNAPDLYEPYEDDDVDGSWASTCNYGYCDSEEEHATDAPEDDDYPDYYWEDLYD